jgi:anthranilate/para-aminobenzoate synthase component II
MLLQAIKNDFLFMTEALERVRPPRTAFEGNEVCVSVHRTDPPIRGVQFHPQTLTSFLSSKARRVLHQTASTILQRMSHA